MNLTTEQMEQIVDGAPDGAEFGIKRPDYDFAYYKQGQENYAMTWAPSGYWFESVLSNEYLLENAEVIKLSDIRAELDSRQSIQAYFASDERGTLEQEQSVTTSISDDFKTKVRGLALSNGFKLKAQPDGFTDLNPYVYEFAAALVGDEKKLKPSIQAYFASDERGSIEQEQSVIEPTHMKCALLRDSSLEKLQWLINESLANGWTLVGAVVSAGIHNDTFVATMMKVAGDE